MRDAHAVWACMICGHACCVGRVGLLIVTTEAMMGNIFVVTLAPLMFAVVIVPFLFIVHCRHLGSVNSVTFVDENRRFVSTSDDKSLRVWEW